MLQHQNDYEAQFYAHEPDRPMQLGPSHLLLMGTISSLMRHAHLVRRVVSS